MTERLHFHFSLSCIGEGNSNPLQCSCLENPRSGEAWWAAVYGATQSRTQLKQLSSSSSSSIYDTCLHTKYIATVYYYQPLYIITDHPQPIFKVLTSTQSSENHLYFFFFCSYVLGTHFLLIYESSLYSKGINLER